MLLLFPFPGTSPVPSCQPSCLTSCCTPPSSGCAAVSSSRLSTALTMASTPSCGVDPALSPSGSVCRMRSSPSAAARPAQKWPPHLAVRDATANCRASAQAVPLPPSGSRFQTRWFLHLPLLRRCQATVQEPFSGRGPVFCMPWTGGAIPVSTSAVPALSAVTASEIGPLTSPPAGRSQSSGGALRRPGYTPV
jgi:hypothetical protein